MSDLTSASIQQKFETLKALLPLDEFESSYKDARHTKKKMNKMEAKLGENENLTFFIKRRGVISEATVEVSVDQLNRIRNQLAEYQEATRIRMEEHLAVLREILKHSSSAPYQQLWERCEKMKQAIPKLNSQESSEKAASNIYPQRAEETSSLINNLINISKQPTEKVVEPDSQESQLLKSFSDSIDSLKSELDNLQDVLDETNPNASVNEMTKQLSRERRTFKGSMSEASTKLSSMEAQQEKGGVTLKAAKHLDLEPLRGMNREVRRLKKNAESVDPSENKTELGEPEPLALPTYVIVLIVAFIVGYFMRGPAPNYH